jgi:hypothetical protein
MALADSGFSPTLLLQTKPYLFIDVPSAGLSASWHGIVAAPLIVSKLIWTWTVSCGLPVWCINWKENMDPHERMNGGSCGLLANMGPDERTKEVRRLVPPIPKSCKMDKSPREQFVMLRGHGRQPSVPSTLPSLISRLILWKVVYTRSQNWWSLFLLYWSFKWICLFLSLQSLHIPPYALLLLSIYACVDFIGSGPSYLNPLIW